MPRKRAEAIKRCLGCEQEKPASAFKQTNGVCARRCRACYAKGHRDRYQTDEAYRQRQIQYSMDWQRRNRDRFNAIVKRYAEKKRATTEKEKPVAPTQPEPPLS
jgi:hypothetical protein